MLYESVNIKHGTKDNLTGLFYNSITNKWVVRLRTSSKGISKNKTYNEKLSIIKKESKDYESFGWLPINISIDDISISAHHNFNSRVFFDIDRAISLFTLLIIKRTHSIQKNTFGLKNGYINIHSKDLRKYVGNNYKEYLLFFEKSEYIVNYKSGRKGYLSNDYSKQYKLHPSLLKSTSITEHRKYYKVSYTSPRTLVKLYEAKQKKKLEILKSETRIELKQNVYKLVESIDIEAFTSYCLSNAATFKNDDILNDTLVRISEIKSGNITFNSKDEYGNRFHSPFTNTTKILRNFIKINNSTISEIDIKNSQFYFLSCLTLFSKASIELLKETGIPVIRLKETCHLLDYYYNNYSDFKEFIDLCLSGNIYNYLIENLPFNNLTKSKVKDLCFKALFSSSKQCASSKKKLKVVFPSLVRVCEIINSTETPIPLLLQRLESSILIDRIALKGCDNSIHPFTTIHDSIICSVEDVDLFGYLFETTFEDVGLPLPILTKK